jgi:hypothetical protein
VLSVLLRYTDSDYPFGIFILSLYICRPSADHSCVHFDSNKIGRYVSEITNIMCALTEKIGKPNNLEVF